MLPELEALLELQRRDTLLLDAKRRKEAIPARRESLRGALAAAKADLERAKKELDAGRGGRRSLEKEVEAFQADVAKLERQLLDVKTNQEYTAMRHQIEGVKQKRSDVETKILESYDAEEKLVVAMKSAEKRVAEEEGRLKREEASMDQEAAALEETLAALMQDRDSVRPRVPAPVLSRYDRLAGARDGVAVAEVKKGACGACFRALTPHAMQQVRLGDAIMICEACGRILVYNEGSSS
ncbi:MAG TPA: C4-type zinc ribbon domain-containing protein [Candidatus Omnitrophota bacterium]|nr:C4-type zinc ribbon domain-containing protein [Candidatus Omnitrophota bacterium]